MKRVLAGLTRWLLRAAAAIGPEEKSEWIEAVLAEAQSIEKPWEGLRWAWGAVLFACRCRILAALGIVRENIMMSRSSVAYIVVFLVVLGLLFATPSFRDAIAMGPTTIKIAFGQTGLSDGDDGDGHSHSRIQPSQSLTAPFPLSAPRDRAVSPP